MRLALLVLVSSLGLGACVGDAPGASASPDSGTTSDASVAADVTAPASDAASTEETGSPEGGGAAHDAASSGDAATNADGGPDGAVDAGPAFVPSDLGASLVLWLDGSRSVAVDVSNAVTSWGDSSGNGNAATATGAARPTLATASVNGHDALVFNGTSSYLTLADTTSMQWGLGDYAFFLVARYSNAAATLSAALFFIKMSSGLAGPQFLCNNLGGAFLEVAVNRTAGNVITGTHAYNDNQWRVFAMRRSNNNTLQIRVNGAVEAQGTVAAQDVSTPGTVALLGAGPGGSGAQNFMIGAMAEVIAVKGLLTDSNLAKVEGYLKGRYAIP